MGFGAFAAEGVDIGGAEAVASSSAGCEYGSYLFDSWTYTQIHSL